VEVKLKVSSFSDNQKDWECCSNMFWWNLSLEYGYKQLLLDNQRQSKVSQGLIKLSGSQVVEWLGALRIADQLWIREVFWNCRQQQEQSFHLWRCYFSRDGGNLVDKFEPKIKVHTALLKKEFIECKPEGASKDPDEWLMKLKSLRWELRRVWYDVSKDDLMLYNLTHIARKKGIKERCFYLKK
jgi:hypothetical protein